MTNMSFTDVVAAYSRVRRAEWPADRYLEVIHIGDTFVLHVPGTEIQKTTVPITWLTSNNWEGYLG